MGLFDNSKTNSNDNLSDTTNVVKINKLANKIKSAKSDSVSLGLGKVFDVGANPSVDDILLKVLLYQAYTEGFEKEKNPTLKRLREHNSEVAKKLWKEKSIILRKKYAKLLGDKLWEDDIEVRCENNAKTIWFIGGVFAANRYIKEFQDNVSENLTALGFKKVCYKWADIDTDYTYYEL